MTTQTELNEIEALFVEPKPSEETPQATTPVLDENVDDVAAEEAQDDLAKAGDEPDAEEEEQPVEEQLDYSKEVPMVNGEKVTIGALKDAYQAHSKQTADLVDRENDLLRKSEELNHLAQFLGAVPPELIEKANAVQQETVKREFTQMLDAIPQWKNAVEFDKGREAIYDLAKSYGLERDISKVVDHRVIKMLYDFSRLKTGIRTAKDEVKQIRPNSDPKGKSKAHESAALKQSKLIEAAKTGGQSAKLSAIESLIRG